MKLRQSTAFDVATTFLTKIFFLSGSFIISILLARLLGPEGKGTVTALFIVPNILVSLADLGVRQASAFYIGQGKYKIQDVLSSSLFLWVITSVLSVIVVLIYYLSNQTVEYSSILIIIALIYIPVKILISYFNGILQGQQKINNMNIKFIVEFVTRLLLVVIFVWIFDLSVVGAALATFLTNVIVLIYSGYIINKTSTLKIRYIKGIPQDMFKKGIVFALALFILQLNYKVDIVFLENMVGSHDLGIYSVGVTIAELVWQLPSAIGIVLFARSANSKSDGESSNRSAKLLRLTWIPLIIVSIVLMIGAPGFVEIIYGTEFIDAGNIIRLLIPGIVVMVLFKILYADLAGRGHPLFALKTFSFTLIINVVFNLILIPIYGIHGAAISSTISYIIGSILFSISYQRYTKLPYKSLFIINSEDIRMIKNIFIDLKTK